LKTQGEREEEEKELREEKKIEEDEVIESLTGLN